MRRARRSTSRPVGVTTTPRGPRSISRAPSAASSSRICTESAGWLMLTAAAARPKCPSSARAVRERSCRRVILIMLTLSKMKRNAISHYRSPSV